MAAADTDEEENAAAFTNPKNKRFKSGTVVSHNKYRQYELERLRCPPCCAVLPPHPAAAL